MKQIRNTAVMEALSEAVRKYGIKKIAPELDKEPSSLYGELNPYGDQSKAKLSLDDAIEAMRLTKNYAALELIAAELGMRVCPVDAMPDKEDVRDEMLDDTNMLSDFHESIRREEHPNVVRKFWTAIHNDIDQSMTAYEMKHAQQARQ